MTDVDRAELDARIAEVVEQEQRLQFSTFSAEDAWMLGSRLRALGLERALAITIDIALGEQRLFHCALPGTSAHNGAWIERKKRTVREFGTSSYLVGLQARRGGSTFEEAPWIDPLQFAGHGGGFPLTIRGVGVVGTIAVSGQPQEVDHALIVEALSEHLGA
ncbi:heme-degrading domain-containing protein [Microcella sp.]|uniref:heme-degrading domain-containing protein n=1 Tax=Microcella sp. TaxID=1913979 RepID=UPI002566285C|nr:heme-degrading domain-containing protein [Microcella sp.]MBX9471031.1 heme-degrading domain-containing protein [Microcella sp.]